MKRVHLILATLFVSGFLTASGFAVNSKGIDKHSQRLPPMPVSIQEAITAATTQFPGQALEAELEDEHGQAVYEIEIASDNGEVMKVLIDAESGALLSHDIEDADESDQKPFETQDNG